MTERNACNDSGCNAFCCTDMLLPVTTEEREKAFEDAKEVQTLDELAQSLTARDGVYYYDYSKHGSELSKASVLINGRCPNLDEGNNCNIYDSRPSVCRKFKLAGRDCNALRVEGGLISISSIS